VQFELRLKLLKAASFPAYLASLLASFPAYLGD